MNTLTLEIEPLATKVKVTEDDIVIDLSDGRRFSVPLAWYPRLMYATPSERQNFELLGGGYAIEFADIDEHIGIEGLLAGRHSGESKQSFEKWLNARKNK